ncbi:unnamed protein product [Ceratitis capitata]|uniref:(Mediterranean fruit fly) hypothetical protein n=1 Tax=Ceratitis capitata TaxID=7213 RepID=A0A811UN46_CERCA|nr:unnamed protein product [Ceratitis capitata]
MATIKIRQLNSYKLQQQQQQQRKHQAEYSRVAFALFSHFTYCATNYLKSYCRIKRHGVNKNKTLCWLTLTLILLSCSSWHGRHGRGGSCYALDIVPSGARTWLWHGGGSVGGSGSGDGNNYETFISMAYKLYSNCIQQF